MPAIEIDGVDFFAVHRAAEEAIARARQGGGPTLLHIETPRYYGHFSGDPDNYRTAEEKAHMRASAIVCSAFAPRSATSGCWTPPSWTPSTARSRL